VTFEETVEDAELFQKQDTCYNPKSLLSFSNVNKGRKIINKCKDLKINFTASKAIIVTVIKSPD
jgi:hypothetical protein